MQFSTGWSVCLWRATLHILPEFHGIPWFLLVFWLKNRFVRRLVISCRPLRFRTSAFQGFKMLFKRWTQQSCPKQLTFSTWYLQYLYRCVWIYVKYTRFAACSSIFNAKRDLFADMPAWSHMLLRLVTFTSEAKQSMSSCRDQSGALRDGRSTTLSLWDSHTWQKIGESCQAMTFELTKMGYLRWPICTLHRYFAKVLC